MSGNFYLGGIELNIELKTEDLERRITEVEKRLEKMTGKMRETGEASNGIEGASLSFGKLSAAVAIGQLAAQAFTKAMEQLWEVLKSIGSALFNMGKEAVNLAGKFGLSLAVTDRLSKNMGYSAEETAGFANELRQMGITATGSLEILSRASQSNLDYAKTLEVSRLAQDAATIGQTNSTEAATDMMYAITSLNQLVLRKYGIVVSLDDALNKYADTLGKTKEELTTTEKQTGFMNAVLEEGQKITGAYESSMDSWKKVLLSLERPIEDIKIALGLLVDKGMGHIIQSTYTVANELSKLLFVFEGGEKITYRLTDSLAKLAETISKNVINAFDWLLQKGAEVWGFVLGFKTQILDLGNVAIIIAKSVGSTMSALYDLISAFFTNFGLIFANNQKESQNWSQTLRINMLQVADASNTLTGFINSIGNALNSIVLVAGAIANPFLEAMTILQQITNDILSAIIQSVGKALSYLGEALPEQFGAGMARQGRYLQNAYLNTPMVKIGGAKGVSFTDIDKSVQKFQTDQLDSINKSLEIQQKISEVGAENPIDPWITAQEETTKALNSLDAFLNKVKEIKEVSGSGLFNDDESETGKEGGGGGGKDSAEDTHKKELKALEDALKDKEKQLEDIKDFELDVAKELTNEKLDILQQIEKQREAMHESEIEDLSQEQSAIQIVTTTIADQSMEIGDMLEIWNAGYELIVDTWEDFEKEHTGMIDNMTSEIEDLRKELLALSDDYEKMVKEDFANYLREAADIGVEAENTIRELQQELSQETDFEKRKEIAKELEEQLAIVEKLRDMESQNSELKTEVDRARELSGMNELEQLNFLYNEEKAIKEQEYNDEVQRINNRITELETSIETEKELLNKKRDEYLLIETEITELLVKELERREQEVRSHIDKLISAYSELKGLVGGSGVGAYSEYQPNEEWLNLIAQQKEKLMQDIGITREDLTNFVNDYDLETSALEPKSENNFNIYQYIQDPADAELAVARLATNIKPI